jgi:hypothetical protein
MKPDLLPSFFLTTMVVRAFIPIMFESKTKIIKNGAKSGRNC